MHVSVRMLWVVAVLAACGDDGINVLPEVNPLGSNENILPYPSSLYEQVEGDVVTLDVPVGAFPDTNSGIVFDPAPLNKRHGWAATTTILWAAPGGVDPAGLVGADRMADSLGDASSTVIIDMTTGARVAHFAEVDANELDHFDRQAVYLRAAQRFTGGHRYAVGIRKSLKSLTGGELPVTAGFRAVLDNKSTGHARLDRARPRLREAVAALEAAGVPKTDLLVAWDFTVEPDADPIVDPLAARDAALTAMGPLGVNLSYTVTSDLGTINNDPRIVRRIEIDFEAPQVTGEAHAGYFRDGAGHVIAQGKMIAKAYIEVPACATNANRAGIVMYGHGFFGSLQELRDAEYARDLAADACVVFAGTQWTGMSNDDIPNALLALNDLNKGWGFGERIWQGMVNSIALEQLLRGKLATDLLVDGQGRSVVDPSREYFYGVSLGHVLGSTFFAYDPFLTRAVLQVGGANWALLFERSSNWASYGLPLKGNYHELLDAVIMEQVLHLALEGVDGGTIAGVPIPGTPTKQFLMQTSRDDTEVPNYASFYQARSLGATLITPAVITPYGFDNAKAASSSTGWTIVDESPTPKPPTTNETFAFHNVAHENARRRTLVQQQVRDFLSTGVVTNTCNGACDCAAGNCGSLRTPMYGGS